MRLATPPTLLVNGVNGAIVPQAQGPHESHSVNNIDNVRHIGAFAQPEAAITDTRISLEDIIHTLSDELLRIRITGRPAPITPQEARVLASALVINMTNMYSHLPCSLPSTLLAFQLGIGHHFGFPTNTQHSITVTTEHAPTNTTAVGRPGSTEPLSSTRYTVTFEYNASTRFSLQVVLSNSDTGTVPSRNFSQAAAPSHSVNELDHNDDLSNFGLGDDDLDHSVSDASWKQRYMRLRTQMQKKERSLSQYKRRIVESVMADI